MKGYHNSSTENIITPKNIDYRIEQVVFGCEIPIGFRSVTLLLPSFPVVCSVLVEVYFSKLGVV